MYEVEDTDESLDADVLRWDLRQEYIWPNSKHTSGQIINYKPVPIFFKRLRISYSHSYLFFLSRLHPGSCLGHHQTFMVSLLCSTVTWIQIFASGASMIPSAAVGKVWEKAGREGTSRAGTSALRYAMPWNANSSRRLVFLPLFVDQKIKTQERKATSLQSYPQ